MNVASSLPWKDYVTATCAVGVWLKRIAHSKKQICMGLDSHDVKFTERDYLWPIPGTEIEMNDKLTQNPGWE